VSTPFGGLRFPLPAQLSIEAMVEIHTGVVIGIRFIAAGQTSEELSPRVFSRRPARSENLSPFAPHREHRCDVCHGLTSTVTTPWAYTFSRVI
jgi:hypothetical protein